MMEKKQVDERRFCPVCRKLRGEGWSAVTLSGENASACVQCVVSGVEDRNVAVIRRAIECGRAEAWKKE